MSFPSVRRSLKRYRAENPYSNPLLFLVLDFLFSLFKLVLVGVVLAGAWLAGSVWMKAQQPVPVAATVVESVKSQPATQSRSSPKSESVGEASGVVPAKEKQGQPPVAETVDSENKSRGVNNQSLAALFDDKWILNQRRDSYTIQLGTSPEKDKMIVFARELAIDEQARIFAFRISRIGNPIYGMSFGLYPDLQSAQESIEKLPSSYRQFDPWIRPIGELQDQIVTVKERLAR